MFPTLKQSFKQKETIRNGQSADICVFYSRICQIRGKWQKQNKTKPRTPKADLYILISFCMFFLPFKNCGIYQKNEQKSQEYDMPSMLHWLIFKGKEFSRERMLPHAYNNSINHTNLQRKSNH